MAATSPRKPRRTKGRHRKPSNFEASNCAHWLGVGAVGIGLAAAVAGGQGTASATADDSSNSGAGNGSPSAGPARASARENPPPSPRIATDKAGSKRPPKSTVSAPTTGATDGDTTAPPSRARPERRSATDAAPAVQPAPMTEAGKPGTSIGNIAAAPAPVAQSLAAAVPATKSTELAGEAIHAGIQPTDVLNAMLGTVANNISLLQQDLTEMGTAVVRNGAHIGDEIRGEIGRITGELSKIIPGADSTAAKAAAATTYASASASASETPAETFVATLQTVLNQLVGWPEPPTFKFVTPANYILDQALDAHDLTIDIIVANPTPATRWIPDTMSLINLFFKSAIPGYTFSDDLNVLGSLLNRIVPPYKIKDPQSATLTKAQVAAAGVGALVKVLDRLLAGDFDTKHLRDAAVEGGRPASRTRRAY